MNKGSANKDNTNKGFWEKFAKIYTAFMNNDDWLCWIQKMNSTRSRAEEVVLHDLIYFL